LSLNRSKRERRSKENCKRFYGGVERVPEKSTKKANNHTEVSVDVQNKNACRGGGGHETERKRLRPRTKDNLLPA